MNINVLVVFYVFKRIEEILGNYIYKKNSFKNQIFKKKIIYDNIFI
jgi:hypothetical protein